MCVELSLENVCAIIPCYNVEKYCGEVIENALLYAAHLILIDDGSTDGTNAILHKMQQKNQNKIHLIAFPHNRGKGAALLAAIRYALSKIPFEILVTLDADGQHLPSEIPKLIAAMGNGDFAIGCRQFDQMPLRSRMANTLMSFLLRRLFAKAPHDNQSGFRAFSRTFAQEIADHTTGDRYEMEFRCILYALQQGYSIVCCPIHTIYLDKNRSSHFSVLRDSYRILKVFLHYWRCKSL